MTAFFEFKQTIALSRMLQQVKQVSSLIASKCLASPVIKFNTRLTSPAIEFKKLANMIAPGGQTCKTSFLFDCI